MPGLTVYRFARAVLCGTIQQLKGSMPDVNGPQASAAGTIACSCDALRRVHFSVSPNYHVRSIRPKRAACSQEPTLKILHFSPFFAPQPRQNSARLRVVAKCAVTRLAAFCLAAQFVSACTWVGLASVDSGEQQANHDSFRPAISEDGRFVAFQSVATNLAPPDSNAAQDIFVRDIAGGTTTRVSVSSGLAQGNDGSYAPAISHNGRWVAFSSDANNLVVNDNNNVRDVFLHDRDTGSTQRLSAFGFVTLTEGNDTSENVDITCFAGCTAAFESEATNLVSGDSNNRKDIFRWVAGGIDRISVDGSGGDADGDSGNPSLSAGGGLVAFDSTATDLLPFGTDSNGFRDIYVRNTALDENSLISVDWLGGYANNSSQNPDISADGRYVAFESLASDLIFSDNNTTTAIYVRDRFSQFTQKVSVNDAGEAANGVSLAPSISGNGRYVAFWSDATNLVAGDTNNVRDIFVRDRWTNTTSRISVDFEEGQSNAVSDQPAISDDGRYIAFSSAADNLVANDNNLINIGPGFFRSAFDIFVRANPRVTVASVVPGVVPIGATTAVTINGSGFLAAAVPKVSGNGVTLSNITIVDESTITMDVTVGSGALPGTRSVTVELGGTGAGPYTGSNALCDACVTLF